MTKPILRLGCFALLLPLAVHCDKKKTDEATTEQTKPDETAQPGETAEPTGAGDPGEVLGEQIGVEAFGEMLEEAKTEADPDKQIISCGMVLGATEQMEKDGALTEAGKKLIVDAKTVCGYDIPIKIIEAAVTKAEADKKAKPDEILLDACMNIGAGMAIEAVSENKPDDAKFKDLKKRWETVCGE